MELELRSDIQRDNSRREVLDEVFEQGLSRSSVEGLSIKSRGDFLPQSLVGGEVVISGAGRKGESPTKHGRLMNFIEFLNGKKRWVKSEV